MCFTSFMMQSYDKFLIWWLFSLAPQYLEGFGNRNRNIFISFLLKTVVSRGLDEYRKRKI
jgi:hypothetical protein